MNEDNYSYYDSSSDADQNNTSQPELRRIEGFLEDDIRTFVGANADKYIERFYCIARGQKPYNWCSALFTASWMVYRKMWKQAVILTIILSLIGSVATAIGGIFSFLISILELVFYFGIMGREGNVLYWSYVKEELTKEGLANIPQADYEKRDRLGQKGGTSILYFILLFIFNLALESVLMFIF